MNHQSEDTICAISSPPGFGAIGLVRLSGSGAIEIAGKYFSGKRLQDQSANTLHFGKIIAGEEIMDEVVVSLFRSPDSYTGEDVVEISCHGSPFIQSSILKLMIEGGARLAREGEFTKRAFLNGKIDLSQAEAVADLIAADSKASKDLAINQLRGGYSGRLKELREKLIRFSSMLELELDFSEEDVAFVNREELTKLLQEIRTETEKLIRSFDQGNVLKHGVPVAIIGKPNVGKSTLLNSILQEEKAIVSEIPGTTRDIIEDNISIGGIMFRFMDTAGLRDTEDKIETLGIKKALKKAESARIVLHILDAAEESEWGNMSNINKTENHQKLNLFIINKIDRLPEKKLDELQNKFSGETFCFISAKEGRGVKELLDRLLAFINSGKNETGNVVVSNIRHLEALQHCDSALNRALEGISSGISSELIAMDIRQAMFHLGEITGQVSNDDLLDFIFSRFCIGK